DFDDILIGAINTDDWRPEYIGETYIIFGRNTHFPAQFNLSSLNGQNGFTIKGIKENEYTGTAVSAEGDINNDGLYDILICSDEALTCYVIFGNTSFPSFFNLTSLDGSNGFEIFFDEKEYHRFSIYQTQHLGCSVSVKGDVNGDGFDDIFIAVSD